MESGPRLATGWTWWMTAFVILVWLAVVATTLWLWIRTARARRRRRAAGDRPARLPALPPGPERDELG